MEPTTRPHNFGQCPEFTSVQGRVQGTGERNCTWTFVFASQATRFWVLQPLPPKITGNVLCVQALLCEGFTGSRGSGLSRSPKIKNTSPVLHCRHTAPIMDPLADLLVAKHGKHTTKLSKSGASQDCLKVLFSPRVTSDSFGVARILMTPPHSGFLCPGPGRVLSTNRRNAQNTTDRATA